MLNSWAAGAFDPPDTINKIYRTAGTWVKPVPRGEGGAAVSYATIKKGAKQAVAKKLSRSKNKQQQQRRQRIQLKKKIRSHHPRTGQTTSAGAATSSGT